MDEYINPNPDVKLLLEQLGLSHLPSRERVFQEIEEKLLLPRVKLAPHSLAKYQIHWERAVSIPSLLPLTPSPAPTTLSFVRSGLEGRVTGYAETPQANISNGLTSTSLDRAPGPSKNFVRGKSGYVPFWPGGLDVLSDPAISLELEDGQKGLRKIPPGFTRGLRLPGDDPDDDLLALDGLHGTSLQSDGQNEMLLSIDTLDEEPQLTLPALETTEIDDLLPTSRSNLNLTKSLRPSKRSKVQKRDWAHVIDVRTPFSNFHELVPDMAHKYPFELDVFQKHAVYHLEMGNSVFVAAHTSAGKTVVAEYAIALAEKHMTRAIYTSPIKALSNQKFRDFKQTFSSASVGILTGDVQINPEASCLIMTTEILRSMLYKGADLIRDVEFVIFDEVHYVNDAERGVVWEEVIIMLPDHVNIILLSATVPNTKEFAEWVGRTKKKNIYVISTAQRPVPLEHYLYAGREIYKIVDAQRKFLGSGYKDAGEALRRKQDKEREAAGLPAVQRVGARGTAPMRGQQRGSRVPAPPVRGRGGSGPSSTRTIHTGIDKNLYVHLLTLLKKKSLLPVVVFTFSKKRCEENASTLTNQDLCTSVEKSEVHVAIEKALSRLKGSDKKLPQLARMRDLLSRGIGVHHGGLLPIIKELVEILFARGLVKILFATETFAMGVNMPARCVVFSGIRKHDGRSFRDILPGEYTQMAGRAGRRGLDSTGTVIIVANDNIPEQTTLNTMILGTPGKLSSQFRLTYNMILNLLRVEALKVEEMIKRSFSENASQQLLPDQQKKVFEGEKALLTLPKLHCDLCTPDIEDYYDNSAQILYLNQRLLSLATRHSRGNKYLDAGRVVILRDGHFQHNNIAVLLKLAPAQVTELNTKEKLKTYFILALVDEDLKKGKRDVDNVAMTPRWPPTPHSLTVGNPTYQLTTVPLSSISLVTDRTIKVDVGAIADRHLISRMREVISVLKGIAEEWCNIGTIPEIDWNRMRMMEFQEVLQFRNSLLTQQENKGCLLCNDFEDHYSIIHTEKGLRARINMLKEAISDQNLELIPDYEQRVGVLQELKFIDENSTVLLKGRVACEINSANELVLTELILENTLAGYEPEEVVALLSCFVFQEKTDVEPVIPPRLEQGRDAILAISDRVGRIQDSFKVASEDFQTKLKFGLIEVVYEWAKGMPFEQITALTDVAEGTIVRVITRLDETCREVRDAARVIGDADLFKKMEESQIKIKRDIVFAASLYF
ncbi:ATP-dependent RNA helicase [Lentinula edodes]|uniref:ATP-dependent RNA helicase n=1 Tax=Lentinula edodes TaxID=5353 RepID=UPI001E8DCA71|nr:ATP-dependent RNA helicase [Lentinula edodes]KAH7881181.1 ATP-dependent RNA helicase [Lentinula edodes]